jgi:radical SAM protein (TIGR01212 family)
VNNQNFYHTYSEYLVKKYGEKIYKLPINLPITCPNRLESSGCTFCSDCGTGFEALESFKSVTAQLEENKAYISKKYKAKKFIAYFQNYTNTFMPLEDFKLYMLEAAAYPDIVEISISTRPDCINLEYLQVLKSIREKYQKEITIELGLQTVNYHTLEKINRGHDLAQFIDSVLKTHSFGFTICTHVILNLPYDDDLDALETCKVLSALPIQIIKIHSLYIAKNTWLSKEYERGTISICTKDEYLHRLVNFVEFLRPDIVIERLFSRVPEEDAVFSNWGISWWKLQDEFIQMMTDRHSYQGIYFNYLNGSALNKLPFN